MILKVFNGKNSKLAHITFLLPERLAKNKANLIGDFNDWHPTSLPMAQTQDGNWSLTLDLDMGQEFEFGYLCDEGRWQVDFWADGLVTAPNGQSTSVVITYPSGYASPS